MDAESNEQPVVVVENGQPVAARPVNLHSPKALLQSVFREDRFFLVLSVFIGVFSGLAVVCFRFAIGWCRLYLLGSGAVLSPSRLLLAPTVAGLVIAVLVIHFSRRHAAAESTKPRRRCISTTGISRFAPRWGSSLRRRWQLGRGIRWGRRIRRCKLGQAWRRFWASDAAVARSHAADCTSGRCGWPGVGV